MTGEVQLAWDARWNGRRVQVIVRQGSEVLHSDLVDPTGVESRRRMLARFTSKFPRIPSEPIEQRLLNLANERPPKADAATTVVDTDPEPWSEPVNGEALLDEIWGLIRRHVVLPDLAAEAIALWILHSYVFDRFQYTPRLLIHSPEKRCGKSLLARLVGALVRSPLSCDNITAAALFRSIEKFRPTLLIDEADTLLRGRNVQEDLRGVLNAGFQRGGCVLRCNGDDNEPTRFEVFAPVALAMIGKPPDTVEDRSIGIAMRRKTKSENVERVRPGRDLRDDLLPVVQRCMRWVQDQGEDLAESEPAVPEALDDRAADCWFPLLALADAVGEGWGERARAAALALSAGRDEAAASLNIDLLADLREIFDQTDATQLPTAQILQHLHANEERPWAEFANGRGLSPHHLSSHLRPFGVRPVNIRTITKVLKGYRREDFKEAWTRYLAAATRPPAEAATPLHSHGADPNAHADPVRVSVTPPLQVPSTGS